MCSGSGCHTILTRRDEIINTNARVLGLLTAIRFKITDHEFGREIHSFVWLNGISALKLMSLCNKILNLTPNLNIQL